MPERADGDCAAERGDREMKAISLGAFYLVIAAAAAFLWLCAVLWPVAVVLVALKVIL